MDLEFANPFKRKLRITSQPGYRKVNGKWLFHEGVDLVPIGSGADIFATYGGLVTDMGSDQLRGKYLIIRGANSMMSYWHMDQLRTELIGKRIKPGTKLGTPGTTGVTTGLHLHYQENPL